MGSVLLRTMGYPASHAISWSHHIAGWWFGTWLLFSIIYMGYIILPIDELHHCSTWVETTNHIYIYMYGLYHPPFQGEPPGSMAEASGLIESLEDDDVTRLAARMKGA